VEEEELKGLTVLLLPALDLTEVRGGVSHCEGTTGLTPIDCCREDRGGEDTAFFATLGGGGEGRRGED
jgi:hypothetical protein